MGRSVRITAAVMLLLGAGACASTPEDGSDATNASGDSTATSAPLDSAFAVDYVGGTAGPVDDSQSPVVIGWVNEQGGPISFPNYTDAVEIALEFLNTELGGVQGHPVELKTCFIQAPADGQRCGTEMVNDPDVDVILTGINISASQQFYNAVAGRKPVLVGAAVTPADTATEGVTAFASADVVVRGMGAFVTDELDAGSVTLLYTDDPVGRSLVAEVVQPLLEDRNVELTAVPVGSPATGPMVQQALVAGGADSADVVILFIDPRSCGPAYDGIRQAGTDAEVVASVSCGATQMKTHLEQIGVGGDAPDGWYFVNPGADSHIVDEASGMATYLGAIEKYQTEPFDHGDAYYGFSNLLTTVKVMNELGEDKVTPESFEQALLEFDDKAILFGEISCPGVPPNVGLCGKDAGVTQYKGGEWLTPRWGDNLIDTRAVGRSTGTGG